MSNELTTPFLDQFIKILENDPNVRACTPACHGGPHTHEEPIAVQLAKALIAERTELAAREAVIEKAYTVAVMQSGKAAARILSAAPAEALRADRERVWAEGWAAAGAWEIAAPGTPYPWNPYTPKEDKP